MSEKNDKSARTFEITAKNFEEGKAQAEAEYGNEGEVSCYLLEKEKKGFLGIGAAPARIRVTVTPKVDVVGDVLRGDSGAKGGERRDDRKPKQQKDGAKDASKQQKDASKQQKDAAKDAAKQQKDAAKDAAKQQKDAAKESAKQQKKQDAPKKAEQKEHKKESRRERENVVISQDEMDVALDFINTLLKNMESEATAVQASAPEGAVYEGVYPRIEIVGDKSGILIGHHGETMDAIQFLANLCVNRKTGAGGKEFVKIVVDIENYREKREETLRALARRMAGKAIRTKRNVVLEPMNPYERHIIHAEIQEMDDVDTHSVGSDENRKVVITYEGEGKVEHKSRSRRRGHRGGGGQSDRSERAEKSEAPKTAPAHPVSEEESAAIKEAYEAYQEEKAGRERPKRATSIDEILGSDGLF